MPNSIRFEGAYQIVPEKGTENILSWIEKEIKVLFPIISQAITKEHFFGIAWTHAAKCYLSKDVYRRMERIVSHLIGNLNL